MESNVQYPIGKFQHQPFSKDQKESWLNDIKFLPGLLEQTLLNLDEAQIHTPYREGGWTVHQLVHHVADSHINAYCRFKLGLTEINPTIRPYEQDLWAELNDTRDLPVNISVTLLHALHARWYAVLKDLPDEAWTGTVFHPEQKKEISLWHLLGMYSWHGLHHVEHIKRLRENRNW
ncbi:MAG: YfiT family bacillithiol transferase [Flavitalea sp.]